MVPPSGFTAPRPPPPLLIIIARALTLQNFSSQKRGQKLTFAQKYSWKNLYCNVIHSYKQRALSDSRKCEF